MVKNRGQKEEHRERNRGHELKKRKTIERKPKQQQKEVKLCENLNRAKKLNQGSNLAFSTSSNKIFKVIQQQDIQKFTSTQNIQYSFPSLPWLITASGVSNG